jgi:hypothetical protein
MATKNGTKGKVMAENLPVLPTTLAIQTMNAASTMEKMAAASPDGFTVLNLDKIPFPSSDSYTFNVPTADGIDPRQYLDAFVVHDHTVRQFYRGKYDPNATPKPPDCVSYDGITGDGDPGGSCAKCPLKKSGACRPYRWLYLLFPDEPLPVRLSLPRTSLNRGLRGGVSGYMVQLAKGGRKRVQGGLWPYSVLTRIGLKKRERGQGMVAVFEEGPRLSPELEAAVGVYADSFKQSLTFPSLEGFGGSDLGAYQGEGGEPDDDYDDVDI